MQKDVLIEITGTQNADGETGTINMITQGLLVTENGKVTLQYDENGDGRDAVRTILCVEDENTVTLDRMGDTEGRMTIQRGRRNTGLYTIGPCEFTMGVFGEHFSSTLNECGGKLSLRYTIDINTSFASRNEVNIVVRDLN